MTDDQMELLNIYRATPDALRALVSKVPDTTARATGEGEDAWSIVEIVCHLRDAEAKVLERLKLMLNEDNPYLPAYDQAALAEESTYRSQSLDEALASFVALRQEQVGILETLDTDQWARTGDHEEAGQITIQGQTMHIAAHDVVHLAQIGRRILAS
jgi:hypothetical protein